MIKVEFTIEPFVEGEPPARVTETVAALESLGCTVEIGPFGSSFVVDATRVGEALAVLVSTAYSHGATHVTVGTQALDR